MCGCCGWEAGYREQGGVSIKTDGGDNGQEAGGRTEDTNLILFENERDKIYCDGEKEKGS